MGERELEARLSKQGLLQWVDSPFLLSGMSCQRLEGENLSHIKVLDSHFHGQRAVGETGQSLPVSAGTVQRANSSAEKTCLVKIRQPVIWRQSLM